MDKMKILLDCDPGHDDAIALILAAKSKNIDLLGVCVESGNQILEKTGKNALNLIQFLGVDVPVSLGSSRPIINELTICDAIHGATGLDGYDFEPLHIKFDKRNAYDLIIDTIMNNDDVIVVTTGPMTNLALAMRINPRIIKRIKMVVLMGGSMGQGNVSPAAEFNILCDPEAAHIVFTSGVRVKMIGLDVTRKVLVLPSVLQRFSHIKNKYGDLFMKLMEFFNKTQKEVFGLDGGPLHDPVTIVSLLNDNVVTFKKMFVEIDLSHQSSYGRTNCDESGYLNNTPNIEVAVDIDVDMYWDTVYSVLNN